MDRKRKKKDIIGFGFAIQGIRYTLKNERNMKIHLVITVLVLIYSFLAKVNKHDLILFIFAIFLVLVTEMVNTAIEAAVDLTTEEVHPKAKIAKDVAAGAVLLAAMNAVIIGLLVVIK